MVKDEMDILKEIGNIAAAHGSIALSKILNKKIFLEVPRSEIIDSKSIAKKIDFEKIGIAVYSKIMTGFNGRVIFLLDEKNAFRLNDISYKLKTKEKSSGVMTEMGMSVIKEIGSIVTSAFVTAISMMFKKVIILAAPMLISGTINEIINITVFSGSEEDEVLLLEAMFEEPDAGIKGSFYLVLTTEAAQELKILFKQLLKKIQEG